MCEKKIINRKRRIRILKVVICFVLLTISSFLVFLLWTDHQKFGYIFGNHKIQGEEQSFSYGKYSVSDDEVIKVIIDPGHGGKDPGTLYGDIFEKDITFVISQKVEKLLTKEGYTVLMTREGDSFINKYGRVEFANKQDTALYVSIHCNFLEYGKANGIEIYYGAKGNADKLLASEIHKEIIKETGAADRGKKPEDYVVIRDVKAPAVLVEVGYLSDEEERKKLGMDDYQDKLAVGITKGILNFFEEH
jgi:N-acetylmuramoyl-L-alanine amidase